MGQGQQLELKNLKTDLIPGRLVQGPPHKSPWAGQMRVLGHHERLAGCPHPSPLPQSRPVHQMTSDVAHLTHSPWCLPLA